MDYRIEDFLLLLYNGAGRRVNMCMWQWILNISTILSIVLGIVSIILAIYSIIDSKKSGEQAKTFYEESKIFNEETRKALSDVKFISVQQVKAMDYIQKSVYDMGKDSSKLLDLSKDSIELQKLSLFSKDDIEDIMKTLSHLNIKKKFLKGVKDFLKGDKSTYKCNFRSAAEGDDEIDIVKVYDILLEHNLYIHIAPE